MGKGKHGGEAVVEKTRVEQIMDRFVVVGRHQEMDDFSQSAIDRPLQVMHLLYMHLLYYYPAHSLADSVSISQKNI